MLGGLFSQFCIERIQIPDAVAFSLLVLYNKKRRKQERITEIRHRPHRKNPGRQGDQRRFGSVGEGGRQPMKIRLSFSGAQKLLAILSFLLAAGYFV